MLYNGVIKWTRAIEGRQILERDLTTQERILACSRREFLQKGFKGASLRRIAAAAGLTTGAIYGYFRDKNAIFEALVDPVCRQTEEFFSRFAAAYYREGHVISRISVKKSVDDMRQIYRFIYDHFDEFRLLVACSEGSSKANFSHMLAEHETRYTIEYLEHMKRNGKIEFFMDEETIHVLSDSYISALLEPVRHSMPYEDAVKKAEPLAAFFSGGWAAIIASLSELPDKG